MVSDFTPTQLSILEKFFLLVIGIFLLQAWFPPAISHWNNGGSWSISVETFFYILFPAIRKGIDSLDRRKTLILLFSCYFLTQVISLSVILYQNQGMSLAYSMPIFRIFDFLIGIFTHKLFYDHDTRLIKGLWLFLMTLIFLWDLVLIGNKLPLYVTHNWIAIPYFVVLLVHLSKSKSWLSKVLSTRILVFLGKASYSFYSLQVFFILLSIKWRKDLELHWSFLENNQIFTLVFFLILILTSVCTYAFVEEPIRKKINGKN